MDFLRSADKAPINFQKLDAPTFFDFLNSLPMHNGSIPNLDLYASHQYALGQLYEEHGQTIGTEMDLEMSALYEDMKNVVHELLNPPRFVNISKWIQSNSEASESGANLKRTYSEMDQNQKLPSNDINHSSDSQNAADDSGIHVSQRRRSDGSTDATFKGTHYINHDACIANIQAFMSEVTDRFDRMIPEIVHIVSKQLLPDIVEQVSTRIEARLAAAGITVNATNSTRNTMELSEIDMLPS